jgi:hypothetical protein
MRTVYAQCQPGGASGGISFAGREGFSVQNGGSNRRLSYKPPCCNILCGFLQTGGASSGGLTPRGLFCRCKHWTAPRWPARLRTSGPRGAWGDAAWCVFW